MAFLAALIFAQYDPALIFSTVETEHLKIHYHEGYLDFATEMARVGEASIGEIQNLLGHQMPEKIEVVLSDNTDDANGSATVLPYPLVRLYVTAPDDISFLAEHQYWAYELIAHELTHIVHLDTAGNVSKFINTILGRTWMPNQLQSRWFIEGLAVEMESKLSYGGRARSRMVDMVMRAEHIEDNPIRLDQALSGPYRWPQGNAWYLHGGRFLSYVASRYGHDKLRAISQRYGSTLIPFAMNRAFKAEIGRDYDEVWEDFQTELRQHYAQQLAQVQAHRLVTGTQLTHTGQQNYNPRYRPDGRIQYFSEGYSVIPQMRVVGEGEITKINSQAQAAAPEANGHVLFSQTEVYKNFYPFSDLYDWDGSSFTRLTEGARSRDPSLSKGYVYYVQSKGVHQRLARAPLLEMRGERRLGKEQILWEPGPPFQIYAPRVSPDGRFVAMSVFHPGADTPGLGQRDIALLEVATGTITWVTNDVSLDGGPTWSPDGERVYFHSARSDIYNIYAYTLASRALVQVTNVMTGVFSPDISPDGKKMAFLAYSSRGYDIWELELSQALNLPAAEETRVDPVGVEPGGLPPMPTLPKLEPRPYDAWRTLMPRQWLPVLSTDALGSTVGVAVTGEDPLGRHSWGAQASFGVMSHDLNYSLSYQNRQLYPILGISTSRSIQSAPSVARINGVNVPVAERAHALNLNMVLPYSRATWAVQFALGYTFEHRQSLAQFDFAPDAPAPVFPPTGNFAGLNASFSASRTRRTIGAISPEYGQRITLSGTLRDRWLGSDYRQGSVQATAQAYQLMPWLLHHVLALRLAFGGGFNELATRPLFGFGGLVIRDPIADLLFGGTAGEGSVRGFNAGAFSGDFFYTGTLEYRAPLWRIERGWSVFPVYLRSLSAAAFVDVGNADTALGLFRRIGAGVGAELRLDIDYGFYYGFTLRAGYARGVTNGGIHNFFLVLSNGF